MRVKLAYTVELDEVPEIAAELIEDEAGRLSFCSHTLDELCASLRQEDPDLNHVLTKMDKVRQNLGNLDARLNEMEGVIAGYHKAKNPEPVSAQPQPTYEPEDDAPSKTYDYNSPYAIPKESEK
jgi:hypothetical protein